MSTATTAHLTEHSTPASTEEACSITHCQATTAYWLETIGTHVLRFGLVAILLYFGALKFATFEAEGIRPLVENSPAMGWLYSFASTQTVSNLIGTTEILIAIAIALRYASPTISALGSLLAIGTFVSTLSFLFTTPGVWGHIDGVYLPVLQGPGGFLVKDLFLLGAAIFTAGEALKNRSN